MTDPIAVAVLGSAVLATVWLVFYVKLYLPRKLDERFIESMRAFSTAVELRFPSHQGLTEGVVEVSELLALKMRLSATSRRNLLMAAQLRDIGLCAIPYKLNSQAFYEWSPAERATYDRHQEVSGAMLELVPSLRHLSDIVRDHHSDHRDAPGIPLEARILKVASEYIWIRRQEGEAAAYQSIVEHRGDAYCPQVVDAFTAVLTSSRVEHAQPSLA